ncbi:hypothetical protein [Amycolatopsis australiensis]|uniref:hypothetical protein n=1 Tax=Amycolatopsis australiensis TaxID=546364 RepID=UPI000930B48B
MNTFAVGSWLVLVIPSVVQVMVAALPVRATLYPTVCFAAACSPVPGWAAAAATLVGTTGGAVGSEPAVSATSDTGRGRPDHADDEADRGEHDTGDREPLVAGHALVRLAHPDEGQDPADDHRWPGDHPDQRDRGEDQADERRFTVDPANAAPP